MPSRESAARPQASFPASKEDTIRPRNPPLAVERPAAAPAADRWPEDIRQQSKAAPPPIPPRVKRPEREEDETDESPPEKPKPLSRVKMFKLPPDLEPYKDRFVRLTMKSSDKNVQLEYLSESFEGTGFGMWGFGTVNFERWRIACEYPCGELIYRPATFRVTGPDITDTTTFTLPNRRYDMDLNVRPGNPAALGFGITFDILGSLVLLGGAGGLFAYYLDVNTPGHGRLDDLLTASVITTLVGGAVLAGGIVLTVRGRTRVSVSRTRHDREEDE